jgi:transmembrane sensor
MTTDKDRDDPVWQAAWSWVMREHEQALTEAQRAELMRWLDGDERHRAAYQKASRVWLLSGLVPPVHGDGGSMPE